MSQVSITINDKLYHIACDEGQEAHLTRLSNYMNQRAKELTASVGNVNESLLLVMLGLLMADELSEAYGEIESAQTPPPDQRSFSPSVSEKKLVEAMNKITEQIERITKVIKKP